MTQEALKNKIALFHKCHEYNLLFQIAHEDFEARFGIDVDITLLENGLDIIDVVHPDDIELFCVYDSIEHATPQSFELHFCILK
jgi:hypothetical protein